MLKKMTGVLLSIAVTFFSLTAIASEWVKFNANQTGVMVIDAQKSFIPGYPEFWPPIAPEPEVIKPSVDRIEKLMTLAGEKEFKMFVTYETYVGTPGPTLMPDHLEALKTDKTISFNKQKFNAVGHEVLRSQVWQSGISKMVVSGAETDVCVLESVLGLLRMGIQVYVLEDSIYTSEFNYNPAVIRMEQAGAKLINYEDFENSVRNDQYIEVKSKYIQKRDSWPKILNVRDRAVFIAMDTQKAAMDQVLPEFKAELTQRLRQHILDAYIYNTPLIMVNDPALDKALPENFAIVPGTKLSEHDRTKLSIANIGAITGELYSKGVRQIVLAGISKDASIYKSAIGLVKAGFEVFLMEDAVLSRSASVDGEAMKLQAYEAGVIPITYKARIFEVGTSVDPADWEWTWLRTDEVNTNYGMVDAYLLSPIKR